MPPILWDDSYSVGVPIIDAQHQSLIALINALENDAEVGFILDQLTLYVAEHFQTEELMMAERGVSDQDAHKEGHREFEEWLSASKQAYRTGGGGGLAIQDNIKSYLNTWLINHIKGSDQVSFNVTE